MKTGLSLTELARRIEANKQLKYDLVAPTKSCCTVLDEDKVVQLQAGCAGNKFPLRPIAHRQLASHLKVPAQYYDRMLAEAPELLVENLNTWFDRAPQNERRMIRTLGGDCRAFMSDRYNRIEHEQIAEAALPVLYEAGAIIRSCEVTERRLYIHASLPSLTAKVEGSVRKGDVVEAGVTISNSEVGHGSASVDPWALFLACLNGMKLPVGGLRRHHVGRRVDETEDLQAIFADDTRKADDRAILLKVRDVVRHAFDEAAFRANVDKMSNLTQEKVTGNPALVVEVLAQKVGATEAEQGGILRSLIEGGDLSAWGLLNAVTAQAHAAEDYDRAVEFNAAGGKLLELPRREWREVLEAA